MYSETHSIDCAILCSVMQGSGKRRSAREREDPGSNVPDESKENKQQDNSSNTTTCLLKLRADKCKNKRPNEVDKLSQNAQTEASRSQNDQTEASQTLSRILSRRPPGPSFGVQKGVSGLPDPLLGCKRGETQVRPTRETQESRPQTTMIFLRLFIHFKRSILLSRTRPRTCQSDASEAPSDLQESLREVQEDPRESQESPREPQEGFFFAIGHRSTAVRACLPPSLGLSPPSNPCGGL